MEYLRRRFHYHNVIILNQLLDIHKLVVCDSQGIEGDYHPVVDVVGI